jgi:glycosyltransferase involved in cell wall biosynthesis
VRIVGNRPHEEIPLWQKAADVLVAPNTAKEELSAHYTSPMKLFEYMASGTLIVASDIPSIREVVGEGRAHLVTPDNPQALAEGIARVLETGGKAESEKAFAWVQDHTWKRRAHRILSRIERL